MPLHTAYATQHLLLDVRQEDLSAVMDTTQIYERVLQRLAESDRVILSMLRAVLREEYMVEAEREAERARLVSEARKRSEAEWRAHG
jgi:hypothetical protein